MRSPFLSTLVLLACSAVATAAHADTFSFALTPSGGETQTYTVDGPVGGNNPYSMYWGSSSIQSSAVNKTISLFNSSYYGSYGFGSLDLYWGGVTSGYYSGAHLFSNAKGLDTILTGTYQLTGNQATGYCYLPAATLVITDLTTKVAVPQAAAVTPEPSSLILLGTGLLGAAGMARRRFFAA